MEGGGGVRNIVDVCLHHHKSLENEGTAQGGKAGVRHKRNR